MEAKMQSKSFQTKEKKDLWLEELANFIVKANKNTWAAEGAEVNPERQGYKELEYKDGLWRLRDSYTGYFRAPGMTTVYYEKNPVWTMAYGGTGMKSGLESRARETYTFLKKALMLVSPERPFRGPSEYSEGNWRYEFFLLRNGDITDFLGEEFIYNQDKLFFSQIALGGLILPKDKNKKIIYPWSFNQDDKK